MLAYMNGKALEVYKYVDSQKLEMRGSWIGTDENLFELGRDVSTSISFYGDGINLVLGTVDSALKQIELSIFTKTPEVFVASVNPNKSPSLSIKEALPSSVPSIPSSTSPSNIPSASPSSFWLEQRSELVGERNGDNFGDSISMSVDGSIRAVGARNGELDNVGQLNIGRVKVYKRNEDDEMIPHGFKIAGT